MEDPGSIHYEDPFADPPELREPARRLRGRLPSPVTIWTAGPEDSIAGLTVSSILISEGEPTRIHGLINDTTELWDAIHVTRKFVVHVLEREHRILAERFAARRPSPGGLFGDIEMDQTQWGPAIRPLRTRAYCSLESLTPSGFQQLVTATIDRFDLGDLKIPLVYFRGRYRTLDEPTL